MSDKPAADKSAVTTSGRTDVTTSGRTETIEFHAIDKAHAKTHVDKALHHVADEVKARLHVALDSVEHHGPVHVTVPALTPPPKLAKGDTEDLLLPADGAFHVKPFHFVKV